jgi:hypothetical protein
MDAMQRRSLNGRHERAPAYIVSGCAFDEMRDKIIA